MTSVNLSISVRKDWILANPWLWMGAGFGFTSWSWLWTLVFGQAASDLRVIPLAIGLGLLTVGLWIRWNDRQTTYLHALHSWMARGLAGLFALLFVGVTGLYVLSFAPAFQASLKPAALFLVWISAAPLALFAALRCWNSRNRIQETEDAEREIGLAFVVTAAACLLGSFTLYPGPDFVTDWDSMRLVLRVFTTVSLYGAALVVVSTAVRRISLSLLIGLHFAAIMSVTLSAPPSTWIVNQVYMRLFRNYLEFVYLSNAYHFYAPDPGPSSYLWFRIIYANPDDGLDHGAWLKIPHLDDAGNIKDHSVALEYQRFLSLTEAAAPSANLPSEDYFDKEEKQLKRRPFYQNRLRLQPGWEGPVAEKGTNQPRIPLRPGYGFMQQVSIPNDSSRKLLESCARYVARNHGVHPEHPAWKFKSVKIYRVIHSIPAINWFYTKIPPNDPELYHSYYAGNYDEDGTLIPDNDPYLYWLLPCIRDFPNNPESSIKDYCRLHAGDPNWVRGFRGLRWAPLGQDIAPAN